MNLKTKVYNKLMHVPEGKVITYKELAKAVNSKAYRFVGSCMANNSNPKEIPCYKVVCSNGNIGNYSAKGGVKKKIQLLKKDGIIIKNGKVDLNKYGGKQKQLLDQDLIGSR